jgi:phosphomannomutase/phosphomannomutase/phosphoglucomutase
MSSSGQPLSSLVGERIKCYPASGEINRRLSDPAATLSHIENQYRSAAKTIDFTDGLSMEFDLWRFNLRCSNTEPVVRLNVETRGDQGLMEQMTQEILGMMDG